MIDFRETAGVFDTLMRYECGVLVAERLKNRRILSLARREQINHLSGNVAVNRGAQVYTTPDEAEGMLWLMRKDWEAENVGSPG